MTDPVFALEPDIPRNVRVARWLLFRLLNGLRGGSLTLREGAQTFQFGDASAALHAEVQVLAPGVYWRILTGGSLAAAQAWIDGDWETAHLTPLLELIARNSQILGQLEKGFRLLGKPVERLRHWMRRNSRAQARENIAAITIWATPFTPISLMNNSFTPARCLPGKSRIWQRLSRQKWPGCATNWRSPQTIICWRLAPAGGRWRNMSPVITAAG